MTFREFKKLVVEYFCEHNKVLKTKTIKKSLYFRDIIDDICLYSCCFSFKGVKLELIYCKAHNWALNYAKPNNKGYVELCSIGKTIEECLDYLWDKGGIDYEQRTL